MQAHQTFSSFAWTCRRAHRWMALLDLRLAVKIAALPEKKLAALRMRPTLALVVSVALLLQPCCCALCAVGVASALEGIVTKIYATQTRENMTLVAKSNNAVPSPFSADQTCKCNSDVESKFEPLR